MAEPEVVIEDDVAADEEMAEAEIVEGTEAAAGDEPTGLEEIEPDIPERTTFLDYLKSPIVNLIVGEGADQTTLYAHQALLTQSAYFAAQCEQLPANARNIDLSGDDTLATSCVLEYLYKGEYFPVLNGAQLEYDPSVPSPDNDGIGLLRHARIYTLAQRFGLDALARLAHRKIHHTNSTAKGEIAYARYVYKETSPNDQDIRKPVTEFWAKRSHVLRHEAEQEFKRMCLEYPQFGFDVLSLVLDQQEKRSRREEAQSSGTASGRKRQRVSGVVP